MRFHQKHYRQQQITLPSEPKLAELSAAQIITHTIQAQTNLRPATLKNWRSIANKAKAILGDKPAGQLTREDLHRYQTMRLNHGAARSSVRQEMTVILTNLHRARPDLICAVVQRDRTTEREGIALTAEQQTRLLEAAKPHAELELAIRLGLLGMRIGEILALPRGAYDNRTQTLTIQRSKTPAGTRRIPLDDPETIQALQMQLQRHPSGEPTSPLFPGRHRNTQRRDFDRAWTNTRRAAHLAYIRFHDLRHTAITRLCEAGIPDWTIRAYVGHVSEDMMRIYSHPRQQAMKQAAQALRQEEK